LPAPGVQDTGTTRARCPDETLVCGESFACLGRGVEHSVVREALMRADQGTQGLRDGESEEDVRPGQLCVQVVCEPLLGCRLLALGTVAVTTGMMDAVWPSTVLALREARAVMAALALLDGPESLTVRGGEVRGALQVCWGKDRKDIAAGGHGRSPCRRVVRRAEAFSCPLLGRWKEIMVVARCVGPRERWMRRGLTPASRRWVAYACLRGWMATPIVVRPARCVAVRKAPWTLVRLRGEVAVGLWG
jgi:hypothetical protein